jgi:hypothetical protein
MALFTALVFQAVDPNYTKPSETQTDDPAQTNTDALNTDEDAINNRDTELEGEKSCR